MSYNQRVDQGYLSLAKGLVTESSALAAVEGSTSDELNMTLDTNGMIRRRRKGLLATSQDFNFEGDHLGGYYWEAKQYVVLLSRRAATVEDISEGFEDFYVLTFHFHKDDGPSAVQEAEHEYSIFVEKNGFISPQFAEIRDRLICTYGAEPSVFRINDAGDISIWNIRLFVRDFKLLNDELRVSERPTDLQSVHRYNLLNAGWWQDRKLKGEATPGDPIQKFNAIRSEYPSNSDVAYIGDATNNDGDLEFDPDIYDNIDQGNSEAPRGHYVFNIRRIDRDSKLISKNNDGTPNRTLIPILIDGNDPDTGTPPPPGGDPIYTPPDTCLPGEICTIEP